MLVFEVTSLLCDDDFRESGGTVKYSMLLLLLVFPLPSEAIFCHFYSYPLGSIIFKLHFPAQPLNHT